MGKHNMKKVILYIMITAVLFATTEIALKIGGSSLDPMQLTFLRFCIGGLILIPPAVKERRDAGYRLKRRDVVWLLLTGSMGIPASMLPYQIGILHSNAATAASIICLNPLFTMLTAHLFTSEKMDRLRGLAFGIGIAAAFFMIRPWDMQPGNTPFGITLLMLASVTFGIYTVMGRQSTERVGVYTQTCLSFLLGSMVLLAIMLPMGRPVLAGVLANWKIVLYCGVLVTGVGYLSMFLAIRGSDATTGSMAIFIKPALAAFFAWALLGESIYWNTVIGIGLLLLSSFLTIYDTSSRRAA